MAGFIGKLQSFDHRTQEWSIFSIKLDKFIKLNKITDTKTALLLTHLSDESYRLAENLVHPKKLEELKYEEIVLVLDKHFKPARSTFADKAKFYEAAREAGESVEDWAARLQELAVYGGFDSALDVVLRDQFVLGFNEGPERDLLLEQDVKELTFQRAVEMAKQADNAYEPGMYNTCGGKTQSTVPGSRGHLKVCTITTKKRRGSVGDVPPEKGDVEKNVKTKEFSPTRVKRKRSHGNIIRDYAIDFTANSNLHGLKYIGEKDRTIVEKVFWLFMFSCSVVLCAGLIRKVYLKWTESPVIVSFAETSTPVWQIPYPAITICFENKAMQTRFNFTEYFHLYRNNESYADLTEEERFLLEDVSLACDDHLAPPAGRLFSDGNETITNLRAVAPNITEMFFACKWKGVPKTTCADLFSPILTEEGQCYTFNTLGAQELFRLENLHDDYSYLEETKLSENWTLEDGYPRTAPIETYPHRGTGYGAKAGLTVLMSTTEIDLDYLCKGPVQGFKILLHNPAELPRLSQQYFRLPLSQEVVVAVKPKMMTTSEGLRPYDPTRRQCYFPSERYLRYFKIYTQANCEMECLANFTNVRCGCSQFGMPRGPGMKVCNAGSVQCIKNAQDELVTVEVLAALATSDSENDTLSEATKVALKCHCLPACTSIEYEAETSQADFDWKALYQSWQQPIEREDLLFARVMIFFKEAQFITSRRSELYGQTDFLANCGGLLGLFMGFSILSVAEVLYFATLRLVCVLMRRRQAKKLKALARLNSQYND